MGFRTSLISLTGFFLIGTLAHAETSTTFTSPQAKQITKKGHSRQAIFLSENGILFISKQRKFHKDPQIYFKDLKTGKERRVTHQRGFIANGLYLNKKKEIIYSSSTDEDKETPFALKKYLERFPSSVRNDSFFQVHFLPQEIYSSQLDGTNIKRHTNFSGFDGFPAYLPQKDRLYFSRWNKGKLSLYATSLSKKMAPWPVTKTSGHDLGLQLSPQENQFIWSRFSPDFKSSQVLLSGTNLKKPQYLTLESGYNWSPSWHPNGKSVLFSARSTTMSDFDLFEVSSDGKCQRQITSYSGDEFFPAVSPSGKKIVFTATKSGQEQLHEIPYPSAPLCE